MKIFILTEELTSTNGWGRYSIDLIKSLSKHNIDAFVVTQKQSRNNNEEGLKALKILPAPLEFNKNYFLAFWYAWKLRKFAKDCDVIHSFIEPYSYIAYWLGKLIGKPFFVTAHGTYGVLPYSFSAWKKYFHKKSFQSARTIFCVSQYTKMRLAEYGLKNLVAINNGLNFEKFSFVMPTPFREKENIIIGVGALKFRKGYHISLSAFAKVHEKLKDAKYYIVGNRKDASYTRQLENLVVKLSLQGAVKFLDSLTDDELIKLYNQSKVFILTPLSEEAHFEGFGLVYLEANACGVPVIGTMNSGAEGAIKQGETGFLVPQNDPDAVAEAMMKLLKDEKLSLNMSEKGIQWAKEQNWADVIKHYIQIYKKL